MYLDCVYITAIFTILAFILSYLRHNSILIARGVDWVQLYIQYSHLSFLSDEIKAMNPVEPVRNFFLCIDVFFL